MRKQNHDLDLGTLGFGAGTPADLGTTDVWEALASRAQSTSAYCSLPRLTRSALGAFPVTEKAQYKADPRAFASADLGSACLRMESSGTAGTPSVVYRTASEMTLNARAVAERWSGLFDRDPRRILSLVDHNWTAVGPLIELVAQELGAVLARGFPFGPHNGPRPGLIRAILEFRPDVVVATPGELLTLEGDWRRAEQFEELAGPVEKLLLLGEPITRALMARLERSWSAAAIAASYGSTETGTVATGCRDGALHVIDDRFVLEVRDGEAIEPLRPGGRGELIVTPLRAEATILVRYATGDRIEAHACACGIPATGLRILGRFDDQVCVSGREMGPEEIEDLVFRTPFVQDYQLEVGPDDEVRALRLQLFPGTSWSDRNTVASSVDLPVKFVPHIPEFARAGGVVKSWRRTRVVRSGKEPA